MSYRFFDSEALIQSEKAMFAAVNKKKQIHYIFGDIYYFISHIVLLPLIKAKVI